MEVIPVIFSSSVDGELIRYAASCLSQDRAVEVFVTVSETEYRRKAKGSFLLRLNLRLKMYCLHPVRVAMRILSAPRGSYIVVTTNPFFTPALCALLAKVKSQKVIHLLYDLFPDALEEAGLIRRDGWISKLLGVFPRVALKYSYATIFLGKSLKEHAETRWGRAAHSEIIPVVLSRSIAPMPEGVADRLEIHYGGQLGWMHDAELLASLVLDFSKSSELCDRVHWSFLISGAKANAFRFALKELDVEIGDTLDVQDWKARAVRIPVGLVSLSAGGANVCLPSKAYGMMACGMAILALCPEQSDLGRLISENELGWVVDTTVTTGLDAKVIQRRFHDTVSDIIENPSELLRRRRNAWKYIGQENSRDNEERRWQAIISP